MGTRLAVRASAIVPNFAGNIVYAGTSTGRILAVSFDAPDSPTGVTAAAGIGDALVSWSPPTDQGASPMTGYDVISSHGERVSVPATQTSVVATGWQPSTSHSPSTLSTPPVPASRRRYRAWWRRRPVVRITR